MFESTCLAVAIGPLLGGLLTDGLGWESVFLLNVPIGLAAIFVTYWKVAESRDPNATRIDWAGLVTASTALFLLVLALLRGNDEGWGSPLIVSLLSASGVLLAAFLVIEQRVRDGLDLVDFYSRFGAEIVSSTPTQVRMTSPLRGHVMDCFNRYKKSEE